MAVAPVLVPVARGLWRLLWLSNNSNRFIRPSVTITQTFPLGGFFPDPSLIPPASFTNSSKTVTLEQLLNIQFTFRKPRVRQDEMASDLSFGLFHSSLFLFSAL